MLRKYRKHKIASIEAKAKRESTDYTLEMARVNNQLRDLRAQLASATQQTALQEQENTSMRERLQRAEGQADHLASENARLVAALQEAVATQRPALRGKSPVIKKRRTPR